MIDKSTKTKQKRVAAAIRAVLVERFPRTFFPKGVSKLPLRIGIHIDIKRACPDLDKWDIKCALDDYTYGPRYWASLVAGAHRVDLEGNPCGEVVTASTQAWAAKKIAGFPFPLPPELRAPVAEAAE